MSGLKCMFFYSLWHGYAEEEKNAEFISWLEDMGCTDMYMNLHTSGHADIKTLAAIIHGFNPGMLVPVHTEHPEWFAKEYSNTQILHNGESVEIK